jgi:hypothetical protein
MERFRYVTNTIVSGSAYGIRADTVGTTSELLAVSSSSFTTAVGGIFSNGVGGLEIDGNMFAPSAASTKSLPLWTAVWSLNDNNVTVQGNNITGSAQSVGPEYGIYETAGSPNGFPVAIVGNTIQGLSFAGGICLGNDANTQTVNAFGNTLIGCAKNVADGTGRNAYAGNTLDTPDQITTSGGDTDFTQSVEIGTFADPGSLNVVNNGTPELTVDSGGNAVIAKNLTAAGAVSGSGGLSGNPVVSLSGFSLAGNLSHNSSEEVLGGRIGVGGGTFMLMPTSGGFPALSGGSATVHGEVTCSDLGSNTASWYVVGHYATNGSSLVAKAFAASPEEDSDTTSFIQGLPEASSVTPVLRPDAPGIGIITGGGLRMALSCTSDLHMAVSN